MSPHAELCRGSKFFYDVIKAASDRLPPESQLDDKKAKHVKEPYNSRQV